MMVIHFFIILKISLPLPQKLPKIENHKIIFVLSLHLLLKANKMFYYSITLIITPVHTISKHWTDLNRNIEVTAIFSNKRQLERLQNFYHPDYH